MTIEKELATKVDALTRENRKLQRRVATMQSAMMKYITENKELRSKLGLKPTGPYAKDF